MSTIDFTRTVTLPSHQAWDRLTAFADHARFVPMTDIRLIDPAAPGGGGFIARTHLAGIGFDDINVIEQWQPPIDDEAGICQLRKAGRLVGGWARLTVGPTPSGGSAIRWQESISIRGVPGAMAPLINVVGAKMFGRVVDKLMQAAD